MLSLIVAYDKNMAIGLNNKMPWHYPEDLKYFKNITMGHKVVMGHNTFQSILNYLGKPFDSRETIVVTHDTNLQQYDSVTYYDNLDVILKLYKNNSEEVFIAGGRSVYEQMLKHCDKLYITHIDKEFDADTWFPYIDFSEFAKVASNKVGELDFCVYRRVSHV